MIHESCKANESKESECRVNSSTAREKGEGEGGLADITESLSAVISLRRFVAGRLLLERRASTCRAKHRKIAAHCPRDVFPSFSNANVAPPPLSRSTHGERARVSLETRNETIPSDKSGWGGGTCEFIDALLSLGFSVL